MIAAMEAAEGNVTSQANTIVRSASSAFGGAWSATRTRINEPVATWVVETGNPSGVAASTRAAVPTLAKRPVVGVIVETRSARTGSNLRPASRLPPAIAAEVKIIASMAPLPVTESDGRAMTAGIARDAILGTSFSPRAKLTVPPLTQCNARQKRLTLSRGRSSGLPQQKGSRFHSSRSQHPGVHWGMRDPMILFKRSRAHSQRAD